MTMSITNPAHGPAALAELPIAPAAPRGNAWIDLDEAEHRSGWSKGHLRRLCLEKWQSAGLAKLEAPIGGGKASWMICITADPSFAPVKSPEQLSTEFDLSPFTAEQRRELLNKKRWLDNWLTARAGGTKLGFREEQVTQQFLLRLDVEEGIKINRSTLFNWLRDFRRDGLAGLVDWRWKQTNGGASSDHDDPFYQFLRQIYLTPRKLKIAQCHLLAEQKAIESGWQSHSYHASKRYLAKLPRQLVIKMREGESAFVAKCEPYIQRDYSQLASNDIWCGDHHRFDAMIRHGNTGDGKPKFVRPWLTAWQDVRSRKIVGWCIFVHDPNTDTILKAFVAGCEGHGVPKKVQIDNGKDYDSRALQGITKRQRRSGQFESDERSLGAFNILSIAVQHVWPYHGQSKPIERFFGTVCERFSKLWETYCGSSPQARPENLTRHRGIAGQLELGKAPSLEEFTAGFSEWLDADYHGRMHLGDAMNGQSPAAVFEECLQSKRCLDSETLLFACMPRTKPVKVGRHGVTANGLHYGANNSDVQRLYGQKVILAVDNSDLSRVLVLDLDGRLLCQAKCNVRIGFDANSQDKRDALSAKKQLRKTQRDYIERRPRMGHDLHQLTRAAATRRKATEKSPAPLPPPAIAPVQTPFDDQFVAIRKAVNPESARRTEIAERQFDVDAFRPSPLRLAGDESQSDSPDEEIDVFAALSKAVGAGGVR